MTPTPLQLLSRSLGGPDTLDRPTLLQFLDP